MSESCIRFSKPQLRNLCQHGRERTVSVADLYYERIASGALKEDPVQSAVVDVLEQLQLRVEERGKNPGLFPGIFGRSKVEPVMGLYLWGRVGRGKSMLMDLFFDRVELQGKRRLHFLDFMQKAHASLHEVRQKDVRDAIPPVARELSDGLKLLCLDEIQIDDIADGMIVGRLFEKLFEFGVTIFTSSNRPPDELCRDPLNRHLFSPYVKLINQHMQVYEFGGSLDYRQQRLQGERTYFCPPDDVARRIVDRIWSDFSGGHSEELRIEVKGRIVVLPRFSNGVLRADFWDMCGQPLGPPDFLAIAGTVRVLILENVPQLSRFNFNEAKRFVMLIDALYEAKTRLIITAASEPEDLYVEGGGAFEFERAASRLREMQGADWGRQSGDRVSRGHP